jgi:hypothetical protein
MKTPNLIPETEMPFNLAGEETTQAPQPPQNQLETPPLFTLTRSEKPLDYTKSNTYSKT